jgi:ABC-type polysaccharide/polyol phosphate transport system ATPase subunit
LSDLACQFDEVTKHYQLTSINKVGLKGAVLNRLRGKPMGVRDFTALDRVSFEVYKGECFGVIGPNGSGKSTALSLMAGVMPPTSGTVTMHGHVCPLLELGAGFHPDLTGRENVMLCGVIMGMTRRQVRKRFDQILDFCELGEFIEQPVRTYSSGMTARLGFSVAAHLDPEILLVDEMLSVGDAAFSAKCEGVFADFRKRGVTIILVSHAHGVVQNLCDRAVFLNHGKVLAYGDSESVVTTYMGMINDGSLKESKD